MDYFERSFVLAGRVIDPVAGTVSWRGAHKHIRRKALEVLNELAAAGTRVVTREALIDRVWAGNYLVGDRAVHATIGALRQLLDDDDRQRPVIRTVPRQGYRLNEAAEFAPIEQCAGFRAGDAIPGQPGWTLVRSLGSDENTETWLAASAAPTRLRAIRFCRSEAHLRWLRREVTLLRVLKERLADRTDVVPILSWQLEDPPYFLSMPFCEGGNLRDWVQAQGGVLAIAATSRLRIGAQVATALTAVHAAGISHGHLGAGSVLLERDAQGRPMARLGGFVRAQVSDRTSLSALPITLAGLTMDAVAEPADARMALDVRALAQLLGAWLYADAMSDGSATAVGWAGLEGAWQGVLRQTLAEEGAAPTAATLAEVLWAAAGHSQEATALAVIPAETSQPSSAAPPDALLAASAANGPTAAVSDPAGRPPDSERFGQYQLIEKIGEGGMGLVYLAEQAPPLQRRVALKVVRQEGNVRHLLARFQTERQTLALMNHPNIAAVYDVGTTPEGQPYFAMEFVPGPDIQVYCNRARLGLRQRLELFLQVCAGVLHAHQRGVIHRDLKPGNILVRVASGQPPLVKIIDFGVAKFLQGPMGDALGMTRLGAMVGTPLYCSPEQADPGTAEIDTRSDIYSLGVVLYEMLVGTTPLDGSSLAGLTTPQLREKLTRTPMPDLRLRFTRLAVTEQTEQAALRATDAVALRRALGGDLSWVVLRCLRPDPDERYASVLDLHRDIERWLDGRPVEARPVSWRYRWRKLVKRHRVALWTGAIGLLLLLGTTAMAVIGFLDARRSAEQARTAAREVELAATFQQQQLQQLDLAEMGRGFRADLRQALDALARAGPGTGDYSTLEARLDAVDFAELSRQRMDQGYLRPAMAVAERDYSENPLLQAALLQSIATAGRELRVFATARQAQELALTLRSRQLGADHPLTLESLYQRGLLGLTEGQYGASHADLTRANAGFQRRLGNGHPDALRVALSLSRVKVQLDDADQLSLAQEVYAAHRANYPDRDARLLLAQRNLGEALIAEKRFAEAKRTLDSVLVTTREASGDDSLAVAEVHRAFVSSFHLQRRFLDSIVQREIVVRGFARHLGEQHPRTLDARQELAVDYVRVGRLQEAKALILPDLETLRASYGSNHRLLAACLHVLADIHVAEGDVRGALSLLNDARDRLVQPGAGNEFIHVWESVGAIVRVQFLLGEMDAAARLANERAAQDVSKGARGRLITREILAKIALTRGRSAEAVELLRQAVRDAETVDPAELGFADLLRSTLGEALVQNAQSEEARALLEAVLSRQLPREFDRLVNAPLTLARLATALVALRENAAALRLSQQAVDGARSFMHPRDPRLAWLLGLHAHVQLVNNQPEAAAQSFAEAWRSIQQSGLGPYYLQSLRRSCEGLRQAGSLKADWQAACAEQK